MSPMTSSSRGVALFRRVLRLHRRVLPGQMRALGDQYAIDEFKRHKDAPEEFLPPFFREWEKYCDDLEVSATSASLAQGGGEATSRMGRPLSQSEIEGLDDAQKEQLAKLSSECLERSQSPDPYRKRARGLTDASFARARRCAPPRARGAVSIREEIQGREQD